MREGEKPEAPMARDGIEEAFVLFKRANPGLDGIASNNSASLGDISYAFRAGYLACRKMAVEECRERCVCEYGTMCAVCRCAAALEKLGESPDSLRAEDEGGR